MTQTLIAQERPLFWLVQGTDFGRANQWARGQRNELLEQIQHHVAVRLGAPVDLPPRSQQVRSCAIVRK